MRTSRLRLGVVKVDEEHWGVSYALRNGRYGGTLTKAAGNDVAEGTAEFDVKSLQAEGATDESKRRQLRNGPKKKK